MHAQAPSANRWLALCLLTAATAVAANFQIAIWLLLLPATILTMPFLLADLPGTREWRRAARDISLFCALLLIASGSPIGWGWLLVQGAALSIPDLRSEEPPRD